MSDAVHRHSGTVQKLVALAGLVAIAALLVQTLTADASRPLRIVAEPTPVAVVDVGRIFEQIDERSEWDVRIEALKGSIQQEAANRQATMERRLAESEKEALR